MAKASVVANRILLKERHCVRSETMSAAPSSPPKRLTEQQEEHEAFKNR
jgi:hypothetical protein